MESQSTVSPTPMSGTQIVTRGPTEDEEAPFAMNSSSPFLNDAFSPSASTAPDSSEGDPANATDAAPSGRKRRLSFKEKQRQSISHFASSSNATTASKSTLPSEASPTGAAAAAAAIQSPVSTLSSLSPQQSDLSPSETQVLQPARKKTSTDVMSNNPAVGCVFTALEPTRGVGLRRGGGAAKPPNRGMHAHASPTQSGSALSLSPVTSAEPSPLNRAASPPEQVSASTSLPQSPLLRRPAGSGDSATTTATVPTATHSSASPPTVTRPTIHGIITNAAAAAAEPPRMSGSGPPEHSLDNIVSEASASSPKASSSSSVASPKMSFKDRQRAAAAAAAASGAAASPCRTLSSRGSVSSPVNRTGPTSGASNSFNTRSPSYSFSAAETSVNLERPTSASSPLRTLALPATAAILSPKLQPSLHVDPTTATSTAAMSPSIPQQARGSSSSSGGGGASGPPKPETSPLQSIPRLPIERIRSSGSGHTPLQSYTTAPQPSSASASCVKAQTTPPQQHQHQQQVAEALPALPPLILSPTPAGANAPAAVENSGAPSSPAARSTRSAPATATERRNNPLHTSGSNTTGQTSTSSTGHPTTAELHSRSSQTATSSRGDDDDDDGTMDDDEENPALAFTQNTTQLHVYDGEEPSPQVFAMATPQHSNAGGGGVGSSEESVRTRSGTVVERGVDEGTAVARRGRSSNERHLFPTRRARTDSLDSPPLHTGTVPSSPLPGNPVSGSTGSHSQRYVSHTEQDRPPGKVDRPGNIMVGHWKQHGGKSSHHHHQQQQQHVPTTATQLSSSQELQPHQTDSGEHSFTFGESQLSRTSRSRARRHRDKMLAPDGAVLSTPRTGRGPGGNEVGGHSSVFANANLPPRMHGRSYTVNDFALYSASGNRRGTLTPSTVTPSSVMFTAHPTPMTVVPPVSGHAGGNPTPAARAHAGPLESSGRLAGPPLPLSPSTHDTMPSEDFVASSDRRSRQKSSPRNRGIVTFPSLPPLHDNTNPPTAVPTGSSGHHTSALSRLSFAMAAVLTPSAPSAENISAATPVTVATPNGYRSGDERSSNEASRGNPTERYMDVQLAEMRGQTTVAEDDGDVGDSDYLLQTYNTYYGGEASLSATTAELRKSRRRSNYSSLHYGTMTGYRRRGDSRRPRSSSAAKQQKSERQRRQSPRRGGAATARTTAEEEEESKEKDKQKRSTRGGAEPLLVRSVTAVAEARHSSTDPDDEESICEQKGSEEEEEEEEEKARVRATRDHTHRKQQEQQHHPEQKQRRRDGDGGALVDEGEDEDDVDGRQRRTVGIWETIENIFLPRYELVPDAVSKEPLTVPASPNSPHPSGNGSSGKPELKTDLSSPIMANLKSSSSSPKALSSSGPQPHQQQQHPPPAVLLASPPAPVKSPDSTAATPPALLPPSLSAQNSPSIGPTGGSRPSGLVVLPDAANLGDDPSSSASLTFSQFRKTPAQMAGTKRLEPEKFTFGTVAANYNMEPVDEQKLPEGAADAKVAARLVFEAASGVMLMDPEDEGGRYAQQGGHTSPDALNRSTSSAPRSSEEGGGGCGGEEGEGACQCSASFIAKDFKGLDCSRYDASELYDHCSRCHRRPAAFLCLHCHEAVCPSHVRRHHLLNPTQCTLFLNLLDIMSSFDRIFWCEKCQQFTWKHTEVYDALVDQIAYTRGTYLKHPARDIHCVGYEVRLKDATAAGVAAPSAASAAAAAAAAALIRPKSEHSISDDATSSTCGSPARLRRAVSGSSVNHALQNLNPQPGLATFPTISGASLAAHSPQMRGGTPPVHSASPHRGGHSYLAPPPPSMLGVNNLIVFGASPSSPMGGNGAASRLHTNAIGTPSLHPLTSPMQHMLSRDPLEASGGRTVAVGEPVTKLCALGASVQGWRTTQEDAEAVFLVDIPALSNEVVDRKELRAMAAAAAANKKKKKQDEEQQQQQQRAQDGGSHATGSTSSSLQHTLQPTGDDTTEDGKANEEEGVAGEEQRGASPSSSCGPAVPLRLGSAVASARDTSSGRMEGDRIRSRASPLEEGDEEDNAADGSGEQKATETIPMAVFCVFDGHGGDAVAKLAARHFETHLRRAIDGTRADDVRARALLFYLNAESNAAAIAGPQPAVTAIPAADGSFTFLPPHSFAAAVAAVQQQQQQQQRGSIMTGSSSPPPLLPSSHNPTTSPQSGHTARTSSSQSRLLVPGNSHVRPFDSCEAVPAVSSASPPMDNEEGDNDMPQILQLPDAVYAESIPVVMPVTAESLRLHMASSTANIPGSGNNAAGSGGDAASGGARAHPPSNLGQDSTGLQRNRRSKTTLDAWADMENPATEMATSSGAAVAAAAASPLTAKLFSTSFTGAASMGGAAAHYGASSPQAAMAASTAYYPSPSAVVSIPEMEMLRQYFASIMEDALLSLDAYLRNTPEGQRGDYDCVGCTACVVGITANFVLCANVGDSGAAFYTKDRIKVISVKHRVSDLAEQQRINAAGYSIVNDRIEGMSAVPRALGDFDFKQCGGRGPHEQAVSAVPDVTIMPTPSDTDQWGIILACDGVWDTATLHQVHVALTNTVNDLDVASSATEAVLRGAELYQHHLRGPGAPRGDSPSSSPHRSATSVDGGGNSSGTGEAAAKHSRSREGSTAPSPSKRRALIREERGEGSVIGDDDGEEARRLIQVDPLLLTAAAGVFAQCVAPADNDEGVGLDNCSLIIVERRNVQE